ncbi:GAF domain-containing SpoIIE family protein phosphatase [Leptospira ellisii]|uniref:GAF domain-containing SpoIIE family protein phosphatase n=1 Tax=Leptospira ellisii TaxID=2023197 RepID=A0A2N0BIZ3_9LEPT|nr:GAF domain-containing SpoIIE family protein phosphatase [Leptospira ellisii]MDV6234140.1 GAF domain-containing SpoIIE family protein phosphatase [Leptospira ellisii]PJZ92842.1 serine/threonine protein phosphatase [Leptospira ellisii]PKA03838.1 serine/threonine protein phosphatase [Leptospira ellisii]
MFRNGRFFCRSCGREWILEKRKNPRLQPPTDARFSNEVLLEFLSLFNTSPNLSHLLESFTSLAFYKLGIPGVSVMIYEPRLDRMTVMSVKNQKSSLSKVALHFEIKKGEDNGPLTECIENCRSIYYKFADQKHKHFKQYARLNRTVAALAVPIHLNAEVLGIITVDYNRDDPEKAENDRYFLELIAAQFAVTLKNRILFEVSQTQSRNFRSLHSAALRLSSLGFKYKVEIFRVILLSLTEFSENELYSLFEWNKDNHTLFGHFLTGNITSPEIRLDVDMARQSTFKIRIQTTQEESENPELKRKNPKKETGPIPGEMSIPVKRYEFFLKEIFELTESKLAHSSDFPELEKFGMWGLNLAILPVVHTDKSDIVIILGKRKDRQFNSEELEVLNAFSIQAGISIQNYHLFDQRAQKERLDKEIEIAKELQKSLLPRKMPEHKGYEFAGTMLAARGVGGDYYDFITDPFNTETVICIGDVSGKGVPAGIVMATVRTIIHSLVRKKVSPWDIVNTVNTYIFQNYNDSASPRFMSMTVIRWDMSKNEFTFSGAGQGNLYLYRAKSGSIEEITTGGIILGIDADISKFENISRFRMFPGDLLIMCTDGALEAADRDGVQFEAERFKRTILRLQNLPLQSLLDEIVSEIRKFTGNQEQMDDITLAAIRRIV